MAAGQSQDDKAHTIVQLTSPSAVRRLEGAAGQLLKRGRFRRGRLPEAHARTVEVEHIAAVAQATRQLGQANDGETARRAICHAAMSVSGAPAVVLLEPAAERGLVETARAGRTMTASPAAVHKGAAFEHARFIPDAQSEGGAVAELVASAEGTSAYLEPVLRGGAPVAVVALVWHEPLGRLPAAIAATMSLLSSEAAVALERADLLDRLRAAARTDELTGLPNRTGWEEELVRELARSQRQSRPLCVVMLDIDHFKRFNDRHGHPAGDRVLRESARGWLAELRVTDQIGRYGGDEFLALLPGCTLADGRVLVERLSGATALGQTCSAGIAAWDGEESSAALIQRADAALLRAKQRGRNQIASAD